MTANATSDTILQGWRRRARRLCTGVLGGWLVLSPAVAQAAGDRLVIWAWERPEDLRFAHGAEVAVQTGFIDLVGEHMVARGRRFALKTDPGAVTTSVVHVQIEHRIALVWSSARRVQLARKVVELARPGQYRRVQIDFEVRASERQILLDLLHDVRAMLPKETILSMTALASWCDHETWLEGAPVDEIVPMLFRMGPDAGALKARLARGGDFGQQWCRGAYALSVDEPLARAPGGRRVYLFNPGRWTARDVNRIAGRVGQWRAVDEQSR